jgi:DNA-binding CsgD family transcriptional regulator
LDAELLEPAGDTARSQALAEAVLDRIDAGPLRAEALLIRSYWNSSAEISDEAVAHAAGHSGVLARALYSRARASFNRGDVRAAVADARAAVELADELGDLILLANARAELGRLELMLGLPSAHATLERARADRRRAGVTGSIYFSAETWLGCERLWRDDVDGARALFEERRALALEEDDADALGGVLMRLVEVEWRAGNWRTAAEYAQRNVELAEQRGNYQRAAVLYARALVAAHLGELDAAERDAGESHQIAETTGNNVYLVGSRCVLAFVEASRGNHAGVLEWVGGLADLLDELGYEHPGCFVHAGYEVEALIAVGLLERAEARIVDLEWKGRELDLARILGYAYCGRGLLAAARGDLDDATYRLEAALAEHERMPMPFERARTLLLRGQIERRARRRRSARESLRESLAIFDRLGAKVWAENARAELNRIGGRTAAGKELTPSEQRIAELVAEGKTNREVAAELFVSVHTVEATLTRVYRKLRVRSRTELTHRIAAGTPDSS